MPKLQPAQYKRAISMLGLKNATGSSYRDQDLVTCPFHSDRTPSMSVNFRKGAFHCFQCGRHGSIAGLVWERRNVSIERFLGIERDEGEIIGYAAPRKAQDAPSPQEEVVERKVTTLDVRGVFKPYSQYPEALEYLRIRGIPQNIADELEAQYSPEVTINGTTFVKRLLIPVYDEEKRLVNIEGRDTTFAQKPKVLYPKNAVKPLFQFNRLNLNKPVFVFEGIIKMAVARTDPYFMNSTSTLGVQVSEYQIELFKKIPHVIVVPDNDEAGKGMVPLLRKMLPTCRIEVLRINNPLIKDADEIPKKAGMSVEAFRKAGGFEFEVNYDLGGYY